MAELADEYSWRMGGSLGSYQKASQEMQTMSASHSDGEEDQTSRRATCQIDDAAGLQPKQHVQTAVDCVPGSKLQVHRNESPSEGRRKEVRQFARSLAIQQECPTCRTARPVLRAACQTANAKRESSSRGEDVAGTGKTFRARPGSVPKQQQRRWAGKKKKEMLGNSKEKGEGACVFQHSSFVHQLPFCRPVCPRLV